MTIRNGFYTARMSEYGFKAIKTGANAGQLKPFITWQVQRPEGDYDTLNWNGNFLNDVGIDIAMKVFATCGMRSGDDIHRLGEGITSGILDDTREYRVKVDNRKDMKDATKTYTEVTGVYDLKSDAVQEAVKPAEAQSKLAGLNLTASFNKVKNALPPEPQKPLPPAGF